MTSRNKKSPVFALFGAFLLLATPAAFAAADPQAPPATPPADATKTASGLVTKVLQPGHTDKKPDANDLVSVYFTGWGHDGAKFTGSQPGKPANFALDVVFEGWREGLMLMKVGEKRRLWVPAALGPPNAKTGPKEAIFDVELLEIQAMPNPPAFLKEADPKAERAAAGFKTLKVRPGTGVIKPGPTSRVLLNYSLFTADGRTADSSYSRKRATAFMLDRVMQSFSQGVQLMTEGEKRIFWIPEALAGGQWTGSPKGPLTFEVELLQILPENALQPGSAAENKDKG